MICASFLPILSAGQLPWISFFPMISFRCQLSGSPMQSGWTVPLCTTLPHSGTSEAPGCIRGEPGQPSAHSTYCVPDRFQILTHSSMTMEQRTNMSKSTYFVCMEEPWTLTCNVHLFIPFLIFRPPVFLSEGQKGFSIVFQVFSFCFAAFVDCQAFCCDGINVLHGGLPCAVRTCSRLLLPLLLGVCSVPPKFLRL